MVPRYVRSASVLLTVISLASAVEAAQVTGRVLDPDGRAVPGATILLAGDAAPLRTAVTDETGRFVIEAPDRGALSISVALPGFRGEVTGIDATVPRDLGAITLTVSGVTESVLVSAAQVEIPLSQASSTVTVISDAEIQARQLHSLADVLRGVAGLAVAATGGHGSVTGVFPRGGESNFTLVFVDDVPVTAFGGEYDFAHLSTANVERIEVVRGPQSALFGSNAIGAVVRVITRRGGAPMASALVERGGYGTSRVSGATSGATGRFEWGASGERLASDGYNGTRTAAGLVVANDDYERASGSVTAGWRDRGASIRAQLRHATDERGVPGPFGTNPIGAFTAIDTISRGRNDETVAGLSVMLPLGNRVRAGLQTSYHRLSSDFSSPFGPSESSSKRWSGRAQFDVPLAAALDLSAGLELQRERAGSTFITDPVTFDPVPVERTIAGYFAEARWAAARSVSVTAGVRLDDIRRESLALLPDDDVVSVNPKGAVTWVVVPGSSAPTRIRAAASTGIRPPGAFDIGFTDNPSLEPERSRSAEVGVHQGFANGRAAVEAVGFVNEFDDLIVAVGSFRESSRYTTDNISNARARGLELGLSAGHRLGGRRAIDVRARVSYTLVDSEILAVDRDDQAPPPFSVGEPLLRRPRHQVFAEATAAAGALTLFASGGARSRVLDVEPSFGTFGGLHYAAGFDVWNVGGAWTIRRVADVYARVENLLDERYEEALGFPALGRRAVVGLRIAARR